MEIMLAIVVVAAVIFFGALISMGNERQRRAIDDLREQTVLWAMQDLRIKRETLAHEVRVDDPLAWLNSVVAKVSLHDWKLHMVEYFSTPQALVCTAGDGSGRVIFSPLSPDDISRWKRVRRSRIRQFTSSNPLLSLRSNFSAAEFTTLNTSLLFELELRLAWKELTGEVSDQMERLWMYSEF